ncbi:translesion error-prone DNA polymerase V autoproteolytic subunit [Shewanella algae]|uniref:LexA family protein n=1 Tax=Shewanella algae TaxID=38313 RepID=UPI001AAC6CFA|nr:translesion error-prone DNA polymerase V autoproteolytic subunit [Shewanella algae]MBO2656170.1 translesion error-prone DNA polymerase V autoproteolytic subunit [Shewanella algae]
MNVLPITVSAGVFGFPSPAADYTQLKLSLDELFVQHPSSTWLAAAEGESMKGIGIFPGSILVIDRRIARKTGDVIVANLNGEFVVKIIDLEKRLLLSDNDDYPPVAINEWDVFSIEGVVIGSYKPFKPLSVKGLIICGDGR